MLDRDCSELTPVDRNSGWRKAGSRVCVPNKLYEYSNIWPGQCLDSDGR